jgi:hypothetical protein
MVTRADLETGAAALESYVETVNWFEAHAIPWADYELGCSVVLNAWDSVGPPTNPDALALKKANSGMALYKAISDAGYKDSVTAEQCEAAAIAVLTAAKRSMEVVQT